MKIYILGIGGTFMSALALIAKEAGFDVKGCDAQCYPPISDLLTEHHIDWDIGYEVHEDMLNADVVIVGNAIKRGMPILEALMKHNKSYVSGPEWLAREVLAHRRVIAVSGTHGKTTTTSMLIHILEEAGYKPGFLVGGVLPNMRRNGRLGEGEWFVIEADEYDSAFFDKRPKFMHYRPEIAILNNLEFDHADIYPDLAAIEQQFHFFMKTIPDNGLLIRPLHDEALDRVFLRGTYAPFETIAVGKQEKATWEAQILEEGNTSFGVFKEGKALSEVNWPLMGEFNVANALAAIAAVNRVGVPPSKAATFLSTFAPVKRRLEVIYEKNGITIYDDFAHHPTAIHLTIDALKKSHRHERILAITEFASHTMRSGKHRERLAGMFSNADEVFVLEPSDIDLREWSSNWPEAQFILKDVPSIIEKVRSRARKGDAILVMSNRGFDGIHKKLAACLE